MVSLSTTEDKKFDMDELFDSGSDFEYAEVLERDYKVGKVGRAQKRRVGKPRRD